MTKTNQILVTFIKRLMIALLASLLTVLVPMVAVFGFYLLVPVLYGMSGGEGIQYAWRESSRAFLPLDIPWLMVSSVVLSIFYFWDFLQSRYAKWLWGYRTVIIVVIGLSVATGIYAQKIHLPGFGLKMAIVNYTDDAIVDSYIEGKSTGGVDERSIGKKNACCTKMPDKWFKGLTVTVKYQTATMRSKDKMFYKSVIVPVEFYPDPPTTKVWLYYFPDDKFVAYARDIAPVDPKDDLGLKLSIVNYADDGVEANVDGTWAGSMGAHSGGLGGICCASLPAKWHPGLSVTVKYQNDTMSSKDKSLYKTVTVPVEPYNEPFVDNLWLLYFPGDKFKIYVHGSGPGSPGFPDGWKYPVNTTKRINPLGITDGDETSVMPNDHESTPHE